MIGKHYDHHQRKAVLQVARNMVWGTALVAIALYIGMLGYHGFEHMSWIDAFANASMILSGMGPLAPLVTVKGKLFAGVYALFSGLGFIVLMGVIFAPIIHQFFRKIHIESSKELQ